MTKYDFCTGCPLIDQPMVPGAGVKGGLVIVGEAPGEQEVRKGEPFIGMSGVLLRKLLQEVGIDDTQVWITNSCLCRPPKNATPPSSAIDACNDRLMEELQGCTKILTLGATALTAVYGPTSIASVRGARLWIDQVGAYCIPTYHPAAVLRSPDYFPDLISDIQLLKDCPTEYEEPEPPPAYTVIETLEDLRKMMCKVALHDPTHIALDLETTGLDEVEDEILVMGIYDGVEIFIVTADVLYNNAPALAILKDFLEAESNVWVAQNGPQFDRKFILYQLGINWNVDFDCMLAHYVMDERQGSHGLKTLARKYFQAPEYDSAIKGGKGRLDELPKNQLYQYLAYDVYYTHKLAWVLADELNEQGLRHIHDDILLPASHALGEIEHQGILIDQHHLKVLGAQFEKDIAAATIELQLETENPKFNPNSPKQVGEYLYGKLKLRPTGTKTGKVELNELNHPFAKKILELRQKQKLNSTYVRGLLERVSEDGRIRASFLLHGTVTGRLSSRDPNLQNIPARAGVIIRDAFVAPQGWTLLEADYNQLELRIAAFYSRDPNMCKTFAGEEDIHARVARAIFGLQLDDPVTSDQRYAAKFVDFGIVYGRGARSLAEGELDCSIRKAQQFLDNFLGGFPVLHKWMINNQRLAVRQGYIESAFGRKRRFALVTGNNKHEIERQAVNAPIQSAASDINLMSLTRLHNRLDPKVAHILVTVHDSLLFEVKKGHEEEVMKIIHEEMVDNAPLEAPFRFSIDCKQGIRWGSLKKVKK